MAPILKGDFGITFVLTREVERSPLQQCSNKSVRLKHNLKRNKMKKAQFGSRTGKLTSRKKEVSYSPDRKLRTVKKTKSWSDGSSTEKVRKTKPFRAKMKDYVEDDPILNYMFGGRKNGGKIGKSKKK